MWTVRVVTGEAERVSSRTHGPFEVKRDALEFIKGMGKLLLIKRWEHEYVVIPGNKGGKVPSFTNL